MDLLNRVGKGVKAAGQGVVGVGKAAGQGVGKVGKGVGQGVGKVGKGVGQGVGKVGKGVGQGVVGVGKGVGQGVVGVGKGVGQGVTTVGKGVGQGVTTVGKGVGQGVTTVGKAAGQGVVTAGTAVGKTAATAGKVGVAAGKVGVGAAATVGGTAVQLGKTAVDAGATGVRTISGRNAPKRRPGIQHVMEIYCSDFYTEDFVMGEIEKARNDKHIINLTFEDMILRESPEITEAATKLLLDTAASVQEMLDESSGRGRNSRNSISSARNSIASIGKKKEQKDDDKHAAIRRAYESITFTECISSAMDYKTYLEEKEIFQDNLLGRQKIRANVPVRFKTKIELHTMLGGDDVKELLREIEKDEDITGVAFPGFSAKDPKRIPHLFMKNFDADGEWKEDALSIEIQLRYGNQDNMAFDLQDDSGFMAPLKNPRKLITRCLKRLEGGTDDTAELSKNSSRGERKRPSKGTPKKRASEGCAPRKTSSKSPPRKTVSEGMPTTMPLPDGALTKRASEAPATISEEDDGAPIKRSSSSKSKGSVKSTGSAKSTGSKRGSGGANIKRESDTTFLDESFSWNEDNEILNSALKPEEKALMGLTKADGKPRKASTSGNMSAPQPLRQ